MIDDSNKETLIEQYLMGELDGLLLNEFKDKLAADDQFKQEVFVQTNMIQAVKLAGRKVWAAKLAGFHEEMDNEVMLPHQENTTSGKVVSMKSRVDRKYFLVAAVFIGLMLATTVLFNTFNHRFDSQRVFLAYYKPYTSLEQGTRSLPTGTLTQRKQAFDAYHQKNYTKSIRLFKQVLAKAEDETVLFYLGNACLSNNNAPEAEDAFKTYLGKYTEYAAESEWYLSLSYLKQGKLNDANKLLHQIATKNNDYSKQAAEILQKW